MKTTRVVSVIALAATLSICQAANAQAPVSHQEAAGRHAAGLVMERRGDELGAYTAFLEAAEAGHPPAQRKLGEIYDSGNEAVERNFPESIRWYEKARLGGEDIPAPRSPMPDLVRPR